MGQSPIIAPGTKRFTLARGRPERKKRVLEYQHVGYRERAGCIGYGNRCLIWAKVGAFKRTTEECVAEAWWRMAKGNKFWAHDAMLSHDKTGINPWA